MKFSPGKGKHTEMKILKWHALKARLKFLLLYGWFSNYELDIPLSYVPNITVYFWNVPLSHEGPIQPAAHPLSHRPVTWLQAAFSLQLFAHDSVCSFFQTIRLYTLRIKELNTFRYLNGLGYHRFRRRRVLFVSRELH